MPRKKVRRKPEPVYTHLAIRLDRYDIDAGVSVSYLLERPALAFHDADDDPVFEHVTRLVLTGSATYPSERAGERFELTIRGDDGPSTRVGLKLREMQLRDENRVRRYREYRGQSYPIYRPVPGISAIARGQETFVFTSNDTCRTLAVSLSELFTTITTRSGRATTISALAISALGTR